MITFHLISKLLPRSNCIFELSSLHFPRHAVNDAFVVVVHHRHGPEFYLIPPAAILLLQMLLVALASE